MQQYCPRNSSSFPKSDIYHACWHLRAVVGCKQLSSVRRYDVLGEFMEYIARNPVIGEAPAVLVAYLGVLTSLASGPKGAQVQLLSNQCFPNILQLRRLLKMSVLCYAGHVPAVTGRQHIHKYLMAVSL